jgi:hypothetical protein
MVIILAVVPGCLEDEPPKETEIDTDGDGMPDPYDEFPKDPNEQSDMDGDGVGDNSDVFPKDSSETADSDGDGVGDNSDEFPNDPTRSKTIYYDVTLETISGWLSSGSNKHYEDFYLQEALIFEITFTVHVEDSDENHDDTDEGSDPDEVRVTAESEDGALNNSQDLVTPATMTTTFEADSLEYEDILPNNWTVIIQELELGGGKPVYPGGYITYTDQGVAWTIDIDYVYIAFE